MMSSTSKESDNPEKNKPVSRPGLQQRVPFTSTSGNKTPVKNDDLVRKYAHSLLARASTARKSSNQKSLVKDYHDSIQNRRRSFHTRKSFTSTSSTKSPVKKFHDSIRNRRHSILVTRSAIVTVTTATGPSKGKKKNGPAGPTKGTKKKGPPKKKASATKVSVHGKKRNGKRTVVYSGIVDDTIPGIDLSGWYKMTLERATGPVNSKGHRPRDHYYYTPKEFRQLASKQEIKRCVEALKNNGGDEAAAVKLAKAPKTKSSKA